MEWLARQAGIERKRNSVSGLWHYRRWARWTSSVLPLGHEEIRMKIVKLNSKQVHSFYTSHRLERAWVKLPSIFKILSVYQGSVQITNPFWTFSWLNKSTKNTAQVQERETNYFSNWDVIEFAVSWTSFQEYISVTYWTNPHRWWDTLLIHNRDNKLHLIRILWVLGGNRLFTPLECLPCLQLLLKQTGNIPNQCLGTALAMIFCTHAHTWVHTAVHTHTHTPSTKIWESDGTRSGNLI